jgi:Tfp pilus assembly protein PilO
MVILLPGLVDVWDVLKSRSTYRAEMIAGIAEPHRSAQLDAQLEEVKASLTEYERSMVSAESMSAVQSELMELAQQSGCQLRKVVTQTGNTQSWEPEVSANPQDEAGIQPEESPYLLDSEQLNISLTGTMMQTLDFLDRVESRPWLMRVAQVSISRDPDGGGRMFVEANLAYYRLKKTESGQSELVQWREGSRGTQVH